MTERARKTKRSTAGRALPQPSSTAKASALTITCRHLLPMGLADLLRCMNMTGVCLNVVIRNDVLPLETSDCSENTDISYVMPTFLKKCYEDKKKN